VSWADEFLMFQNLVLPSEFWEPLAEWWHSITFWKTGQCSSSSTVRTSAQISYQFFLWLSVKVSNSVPCIRK